MSVDAADWVCGLRRLARSNGRRHRTTGRGHGSSSPPLPSGSAVRWSPAAEMLLPCRV